MSYFKCFSSFYLSRVLISNTSKRIMRWVWYTVVLLVHLSIRCTGDETVPHYIDVYDTPDRQSKVGKDNKITFSPSRKVHSVPIGYRREIGEVEMVVANKKPLKGGAGKRTIYNKEPGNRQFVKKMAKGNPPLGSDAIDDKTDDFEDKEDESNSLIDTNEDNDLSDETRNADDRNEDVYVNMEDQMDRNLIGKDKLLDKTKKLYSSSQTREKLRGSVVKPSENLELVEYMDRGEDAADLSNSVAGDIESNLPTSLSDSDSNSVAEDSGIAADALRDSVVKLIAGRAKRGGCCATQAPYCVTTTVTCSSPRMRPPCGPKLIVIPAECTDEPPRCCPESKAGQCTSKSTCCPAVKKFAGQMMLKDKIGGNSVYQ